MWDYTDKVMDHFRHPRNVGKVENPDGTGTVGSLVCGDSLTLTFKLDADKRIEDVKFQTFGCASAIASSSALTELLKGKTIEETEKITNKEIADYLGGLPDQKMHCSVMGREALEAAIYNYRTGKPGVRDLKEEKIICTCFNVSEEDIIKVATENDLTTVDEITDYCKAGGACGRCRGAIKEILDNLAGKGKEPEAAAPVGDEPKRKLSKFQMMKKIDELFEKEIRPALRGDNGDVELIDFEDGKVVIAFHGMCKGCPSAGATRRDFIQAKLRETLGEELEVVEE